MLHETKPLGETTLMCQLKSKWILNILSAFKETSQAHRHSAVITSAFLNFIYCPGFLTSPEDRYDEIWLE